MTNIALLVVCMLVGMILRRTRRVPDNAHVSINAFIVHVALPALILGQIHGLRLTPELLFPVSMPWVLFALSVPVFVVLGRAMRFPAAVTGALIITAGLANTSFVGLPMIETFYGAKDLSTGILIDQLGTYLVLSTLGITVACIYSSGTASWREIAQRIVTFPPLIALVLALALSPVGYPAWLAGMLHRLGDTLAPLALVSVGLQLRLDQLSGNRLPLGLGLGFKLVVGPLLIALVYFGALSWGGETSRVTIFEAAMGPMIGGAIVAMQYGLSQSLITLMVGVGITLSFLTLPLWYLGLALI
jgi:malate permease and related proteins